MKKKFNLDDHLLSMNLQYFADPNGSGEPGSGAPASNEPNGSGAPASNEPTEPAKPAEPTKPAAKYTDADLDRIIGEKKARWLSEQQAAQTEAKKYEEMNDAEKAKFDRDKATAERDALQAQLDKSRMLSTTRQLFSEAGLPADESIISMVTTTEADSTKENLEMVKAFAKSIKEAAEREFLLGDKQHVSGNELKSNGSLGAELAKATLPDKKRPNPYF
jgi:hypothetical protein